ncbi:MAG: hypothetical protein ACK4M7_04890 [Burkholderiales bacterium]
MATITTRYFDALTFVRKSRELGVPEQIAEYQARQFEQVINIVSTEIKAEIKQELHADELVTKGDLKQQLEITKLELQKEIEVVRREIEVVRREIEVVRNDIKKSEIVLLIIFGSGFLALLGVLAKGFHWI